jgi:hypothetical protein
MRRRGNIGATTLRWARGPGTQSGVWALSALAIAALPLIALLRPECRGNLLACDSEWDQILMLPRLAFGPAAVTALVMTGSWWAQRRNAAVDDRYFAALENADQPDAPPGHFDAPPLNQDLVKRTLRGAALGAFIGTLGAIGLAMTSLGRRACDPWAMQAPTGLAVCSRVADWTDLIVAFELWVVVALSGLACVVWYTRSTSITVIGIPKKRRKLRRAIGRNKTNGA